MSATPHKLTGEERLKASTNSGESSPAPDMSGEHTAFFYGAYLVQEVL